VKYRERAASVVGAVLWERTSEGTRQGTPIMPDGCMDLLWDGKRLFVAGPDTTARWHWSPSGTNYVALLYPLREQASSRGQGHGRAPRKPRPMAYSAEKANRDSPLGREAPPAAEVAGGRRGETGGRPE